MPYAKHPCPDCGKCISKVSARCRTCDNARRTGSNNPSWKGGVSSEPYRYKKVQVERYPEKIWARQRVYHAIRSGRLRRLPCEWPGCTIGSRKTEAHHWSYKPGHELDVNFFCRPHHRFVDQINREQFLFILAASRKEDAALITPR